MKSIAVSLSLMVVLAISAAASANIITVNPIADTYTYNNWGTSPTVNHGAEDVIWAQKDPAHLASQISLLNFDLSALNGATINSATLTLYNTNKASGTISVNVARVTTAWDEMTATWNQPTATTSWVNPLKGADWTTVNQATGTATVVTAYNTVLSVVLTALIQDLINDPSANYGICIYGDPTSDRFGSRENLDAARRPLLTIDYTPVPEPATMALLVIGGMGLLARRRNRA